MAGYGLEFALLLRSIVDEGKLKLPAIRQMSRDFYRKHHPGFFSPFKSFQEFGLSLAIPIGAPLLLGTITALLGAVAGFSTIVCVSSFAVGGFCAAINKIDARNDALSLGVISGLFAALSPLLILVTALLTVASFILPFVSLVTRSGATIISGIKRAVEKSNSSEEITGHEKPKVECPTL